MGNNLKNRLFGKPPWKQSDPAQRAQGLAEAPDSPELREALADLAQHDENVSVRLVALQRLNTEAFWLDARLRESDQEIIEAADAFLKRAVMHGVDDRLDKERLDWLERIDEKEFIRQVAVQAPEKALRAAALQRIDAQGFLGDCYVSEGDDSVADSLLARIDQESTLERIIGKLRKTSKQRARAAEQRLEEVRAASGKTDPGAESARRLVEQIESLSRGEYQGDRRECLESLEAQWHQAPRPDQKLQRRFEGAARIVHSSLQRPAASNDKPQDKVATPTDEGPLPELLQLQSAIERQAGAQRIDDHEAARLLGEWDRLWNRTEHPTDADLALRERLQPSVHVLQKAHEKAAGRSASPNPASDTESQTDQINRELDQIGESLDDGDIAAAHDRLRQVRSDFDRQPSRGKAKSLAGRIARFEGRLKELRNWQHWSNNQIRDELIERIEQLADSDQHPDAITAALKEARNEWQRLEKLEVLPGDKRRHAAPPGQWRRFQAACKNAFDKAKPFFEKRHEVQEQNLEALDAFVEKGHQLASEPEADGKQLLAFQRKARRAIRRLDDLPPKSRGRSAARLRELMDGVSARLDAIYEDVEQTKRKLVAEARNLTHEPDLKTAIARAKELQAHWQRAGSGRRRIEQKLWKEFREPIDPLFEQLSETRHEQHQKRDEELAGVRQLCEQAEALADLSGEELAEAEGRMKGLIDDWQEQQGVPSGLLKRFEKATTAFGNQLAKRRTDLRNAKRQKIQSIVTSIQETWTQRLQTGSTDDLNIKHDSEGTEGELHSTLVATLDRCASADSTTEELEQLAEKNAELARQVVIEMEFLAGQDSPAEDRKQRMDYQVKRLARRLSDRDEQPDLGTELEQLRHRWYLAFPLPPEAHDPLMKRFEKCRKVIESMIGR